MESSGISGNSVRKGDQLPIGRALGLHWDADSDTLLFKVVPTNKPPTKRGILSMVSSLFDPLGFVSPFILPVKVLLQELWRMGIQWDERVLEPLLTQWHRWVESLLFVAKIKIPRCFRNPFHSSITNIQLQYFSDACNHGYAAVSYLRLVDDQGNVHCAFVMGKTRNTLLKQWSVPRLELQAAVISTRLHVLIHDELDLPVHSVTFWSDSLTVLYYITNEKRRFKPFIANRVTEIHDVSAPEQWRHVSTSLNPAWAWAWETLIRSVRKSMRGILGNQNALVSLETLRTMYAEVVTILNSRPLTPSSDDPSDCEPLTPSHLLLQRRNLVLPPGSFVREDLYRRKQWRQAQFLADCFWKRGIREYVPALQQRQKWVREKGNLAIGDLVLVVDDNSPRGRWLIGRVIKTFPGPDDRVRVAEIKTSTLTRQISKLCLLEEAG